MVIESNQSINIKRDTSNFYICAFKDPSFKMRFSVGSYQHLLFSIGPTGPQQNDKRAPFVDSPVPLCAAVNMEAISFEGWISAALDDRELVAKGHFLCFENGTIKPLMAARPC